MAAVVGLAGPSHLAAVPASAEEFMEVVAVCLFFFFFNERPCRSWCWCVVVDVCSIQNLIGVVYVLVPLVSIASPWPGFEFKSFWC